jgi:hypothetical protein
VLNRLSDWKDKAEALAGMFAVFFIGFAPAILGVLFGLASLVNAENARDLPAWVCFSVALVTGTLAVWLARMAQRALYMCYPEMRKLDQSIQAGQKSVLDLAPDEGPTEKVKQPMAIVVGLNLPRIPVILAVPLALYWLAHAGSGVFIGLKLDVWVDSAFRGAPDAVKFLLPQVLNFAFSFASNIYLMLAAALFVRRLTVLEKLWSLRLLIDLILTAITAVPATLEWLKKVWS